MKLFVIILVLIEVTWSYKNLDTVYQWRYIDYLWDSQQQRDLYIRNGEYNHENIVPIDVDRARDGRIFVTAIRNTGVPASLTTVTNMMGPSGPLLKPYPSWSWYRKGDCNGITSVYRVTIDDCNKLYVLDTGYIGDNYTCPAQILIFDLYTDNLVRRIRIPDNVSHNRRGVGKLVTPVIETEGPTCELQSIFMADVNGRGLVIWNKFRLFRLESQIFETESPHVRVEIAGESFELDDSLMGIALDPTNSNYIGRELFLRPFSSRSLFIANTRVLSRSTFGNGVNYITHQDSLPSQATAMGVSSHGVLFFGLTREIAIGCWNRHRNGNIEIAVQDQNRLQFISGLKVLPRSRTQTGDEEVWALSNRLQKIMTGSINFNEINFRIVKGSVSNLISGTSCEVSRRY